MTTVESLLTFVTAVEVQEELGKFRDMSVQKIRELNSTRFSLEREVRLLDRARDDSWEVISQRLSTLVHDSITSLPSRLTDLEHTVQARMTTPVTKTSTTHVSSEALATIEQALISEIERVRDDHTKSMSRLLDLIEGFSVVNQRQAEVSRETVDGITEFCSAS